MVTDFFPVRSLNINDLLNADSSEDCSDQTAVDGFTIHGDFPSASDQVENPNTERPSVEICPVNLDTDNLIKYGLIPSEFSHGDNHCSLSQTEVQHDSSAGDLSAPAETSIEPSYIFLLLTVHSTAVDLSLIANDLCEVLFFQWLELHGLVFPKSSLQEDVQELLKESCKGDTLELFSSKPEEDTIAMRREVVMSEASTSGTRVAVDLASGEMQWLEPLGRDSNGNKTFAAAFRGRGLHEPLYVCRSSCVLLRAAENPDSFYVARATKLYERSSDGAKMVSCQWFYRAEDTILAHRKGSANRVGKQELFESDSVDENSLHSIEDICEVLAEPLLDDVQSWLSGPVREGDSMCERYFYGSKYIPSLKCFRALNDEDLRIARFSFAASSRAVEQTSALRCIGQLKRASLLPAAEGLESSAVRMSLKLSSNSSGTRQVERISLEKKVILGSEWPRILSGEVYCLIAAKTIATTSRVRVFEFRNSAPSAEEKELLSDSHQSGMEQETIIPRLNQHTSMINCASNNENNAVLPASLKCSSEPGVEDSSMVEVNVVGFDCTTSSRLILETSLSAQNQITASATDAAPPITNVGSSFPAEFCHKSDNSMLAEETPSCASYSSPPRLGSQALYSNVVLRAHTPVRSLHSAPRLQVAKQPESPPQLARNVRKARRDERVCGRESRRGLEVEFGGVTVNQLMTKRLRKFDAQHSRYIYCDSSAVNISAVMFWFVLQHQVDRSWKARC